MAEVTYYFNARGDVVWTDPDNIVDNNLETFGYTNVKKTAQTLTGNTCPATDLGTITKVELRLYGKGDGNDRIDITPVFVGGNGDTHETVPVVDPGGWVAYVDITNDTNHPDWSLWSHVQDLDCIINSVAVGKANTLYCAKVEIRVTYARVTTQAVDEIQVNQARGNGTTYASCNKRGFCWNETGNPTVADDKVEETDSFGAGSFSLYMTGLDVSTHYYVKAYIYIDAAYEYGNQVEFDTLDWQPPEADIDVGASPIDRIDIGYPNYTHVDKNNPANASGTLHSVKVYANTNLTGLRVGTFYTTNGNTLKCRASVVIGNVEAGAERTFTELSIEVQEGDYIGCYFTAGNIERHLSGFAGIWYLLGEYIDPNDEAEYTFYGGDAISLYGYGDIAAPPTVTTQAVSDIEATTATGHGTIVSVGIENASKRGVCWNTIGDPTVADDKSEETNSFGTGAFTRPMTGLSPVTHYYVRAYAYNSAGYGYGDQVEFDTAWEPPVSDIDVGADPIDRTTTWDSGYTIVDKNNPANASGVLHSIKIHAYVNITGLRVGTFYTTNGNTIKCRDSVVIGDVEAGAERTFNGLSITVEEGDYIGGYFTDGFIDRDMSGFSGMWWIFGEYIDPNDEATYGFYEGDAISLYGYGDIEAPPVGQPYISRVQRIAGMRTMGVNQVG